MIGDRAARVVSGLLGVLIALGTMASGEGQSLADIARREEARRKTVKHPTKVYTNKDLKRVVPAGSETTPSPNSTDPQTLVADKASRSTSSETQKPDKPARAEEPQTEKDEAYWRARIDTARTALERNRLLLEALQTKINSLTADVIARDDPAQRAVLANERLKHLAEMERIKSEVASLEKGIADIEEEARRANVPPGWLR